jgi:hypothetical protein
MSQKKIINPKTGRLILVGGPTFLKLSLDVQKKLVNKKTEKSRSKTGDVKILSSKEKMKK